MLKTLLFASIAALAGLLIHWLPQPSASPAPGLSSRPYPYCRNAEQALSLGLHRGEVILEPKIGTLQGVDFIVDEAWFEPAHSDNPNDAMTEDVLILRSSARFPGNLNLGLWEMDAAEKFYVKGHYYFCTRVPSDRRGMHEYLMIVGNGKYQKTAATLLIEDGLNARLPGPHLLVPDVTYFHILQVTVEPDGAYLGERKLDENSIDEILETEARTNRARGVVFYFAPTCNAERKNTVSKWGIENMVGMRGAIYQKEYKRMNALGRKKMSNLFPPE